MKHGRFNLVLVFHPPPLVLVFTWLIAIASSELDFLLKFSNE